MQDPRISQKEYDKKIDAIKKCGENRGPHDYIPIQWNEVKVEGFMCRVCFNRVSMESLEKHFPNISF